jgi:hypothetical protein
MNESRQGITLDIYSSWKIAVACHIAAPAMGRLSEENPAGRDLKS